VVSSLPLDTDGQTGWEIGSFVAVRAPIAVLGSTWLFLATVCATPKPRRRAWTAQDTPRRAIRFDSILLLGYDGGPAGQARRVRVVAMRREIRIHRVLVVTTQRSDLRRSPSWRVERMTARDNRWLFRPSVLGPRSCQDSEAVLTVYSIGAICTIPTSIRIVADRCYECCDRVECPARASPHFTTRCLGRSGPIPRYTILRCCRPSCACRHSDSPTLRHSDSPRHVPLRPHHNHISRRPLPHSCTLYPIFWIFRVHCSEPRTSPRIR
jgi:hypothetical protein